MFTWARHHLHQTPVSKALRQTPGLRVLATNWWLSAQQSSFKASLQAVGRPIERSTSAETILDIPTVSEISAQHARTTELGDLFSAEMLSWCRTSKFFALGYQDVYARVLKHLRTQAPRILEVGIGVNDPNSVSGMGKDHQPGSSLLGWSQYFPSSEVHGADVDRRVLIDTGHYVTHWVDQRDPGSLTHLGALLGAPLHLIVDDGLHTPEANGHTLYGLLPYLGAQGVFVVEDILPEFNNVWLQAADWLPPDYGMTFYPGSTLRSVKDAGIAVFWRR